MLSLQVAGFHSHIIAQLEDRLGVARMSLQGCGLLFSDRLEALSHIHCLPEPRVIAWRDGCSQIRS